MEEGFGPKNVTEFRFRCLLLKSETSAGRNRKISLIRRPATWGEGELMSQKQLQTFCSAMKVFKGTKKKQSQLSTEVGSQICSHIPLHTGFLTPWSLSLDALLFIQFVHKVTEGQAREKP